MDRAGETAILRARWVLPISAPPLEDGAVEILGGNIARVAPWREFRGTDGTRAVDLGDGILLPGLINAHCHLDYTMLRKAIAPPASFADWILRLNALKRSFSDADYLAAIGEGFRELLETGTTAVANIGAFPGLARQISAPPIRAFWFHEVMDPRGVAPDLSELPFDLPWAEAVGISPHAPYTTSAALYRAAAAAGCPLTTHLAESAEETRMFLGGEGPLFDLLASVGRRMDDCGGARPARRLLEDGQIPRRTLLVHVNEVSDEELPLLAGRTIAHCPKSHRYFGHPPFRWADLVAAGATVCLGTDSLASNDSLDLFSEIRVARALHPEIRPDEILRAATVGGARALGREGLLGEIAEGAWADLIYLDNPDQGADPVEAAIEHRGPVSGVMVGGEPVYP